jgi:hypothetical protein
MTDATGRTSLSDEPLLSSAPEAIAASVLAVEHTEPEAEADRGDNDVVLSQAQVPQCLNSSGLGSPLPVSSD